MMFSVSARLGNCKPCGVRAPVRRTAAGRQRALTRQLTTRPGHRPSAARAHNIDDDEGDGHADGNDEGDEHAH